MKTLNFLRFNILFFGSFLIVLSSSLISCGDDDDKVNCSKLEERGITVSFEALEAIFSDDCDGIEDAYTEIIKIVKQGKSCAFVQDMMDDYAVDNIDELEDALLAERDEHLEASQCL